MGNALSRQIGVCGAAFALVALAAPAHAQFGGMLSSLGRSSQTKTAEGCPKGKKRSAGSQIFGSIAGSVAGSAASRAGIYSWVPISGLTDQLTAAIACKLDPEEQKQAAQATLDATRGEGDAADVAVGSSASWTSGTRADVSGTSTVIARNDEDDGSLQCIMVSDVIIVSGEETRADKRMCRRPPAVRYALT
jgi:hypothetical protein